MSAVLSKLNNMLLFQIHSTQKTHPYIQIMLSIGITLSRSSNTKIKNFRTTLCQLHADMHSLNRVALKMHGFNDSRLKSNLTQSA